jgi:hypothetical protein
MPLKDASPVLEWAVEFEVEGSALLAGTPFAPSPRNRRKATVGTEPRECKEQVPEWIKGWPWGGARTTRLWLREPKKGMQTTCFFLNVKR